MSRIFVLGNATMDLTLAVPAWPGAGETVLARSLSRWPGGKGLNQAHAAARAGGTVTLAAPVGDDADGAYLRSAVAESGLFETRWRLCDAATDISTIWVAEGGENMIVSSADCARSVGPEEVARLLDGFAAGDFLVVQGNFRAQTTVDACRYAVGLGGRTILNTAPIDWPMEELLGLVDVVVCNRPEAEAIAGPADDSAARIAEMARGAVVLTLGAEGALVVDGGAATRIAAPRVAAVDTSGAGDVAVGFLAAALAERRPLRAAAEIAVRAASLSVTRPGTLSSCPAADEVAPAGAAAP